MKTRVRDKIKDGAPNRQFGLAPLKGEGYKVGVIHAQDALATKYFKILKSTISIVNLNIPKASPNLIIVIGGDGTMLHAIHKYMHLNVPFYGINTGQLGFLMNSINLKTCKNHSLLLNALSCTEETLIFPLEMSVLTVDNKRFKALAINEVSLLRQTCQAAKIEISVNNKLCLELLVSDGVMISTPAGSTAYNFSAGGQILPIGSNLLALTPISPFRPRRWHGALIRNDSIVTFKILSPKKRSVSAVADFFEIRNATRVDIKSLPNKRIKILFDKNHSFDSRVIKEQFPH